MHNTFASQIASLIEASDMPRATMARRLGYSNPNVITMFKQGLMRVPFDNVVPIAHLLGADPGRLITAWMNTYMPGVLQEISEHVFHVRGTG